MTQLKCRYGDDEFYYKVIYLPQREKLRRRTIAIHIHPNGVVQVDAPEDTDSTEIRQAVSKRARWVVKHLAEIRQRQREVLPRRYISGESHFYLGRRYMLKVNHAPRLAAEVKLLRGCLKVS
ncbi:YgjP-like metallopeptidase domain-containing protein, partial [Thiolapillus sp.]